MSMAQSSSSALDRHVPGLDGLRGVDVAVVVLFHGEVAAAGGFLGVSQFFTLSGFLVMSILLRATAGETGLDLMSFWRRRYRRLMPASLLTLAAVVVFGFTLATEQQVDDLRRAIPAALGQVVNWLFILDDTSYVELFQSPSPIQHFWSLAIEEQFYVVVPLIVLAAMARKPRLGVMTGTFGILTVASTVWMFVLFEQGAAVDRLYYGTDTRAAEMLIGCTLALLLYRHRPDLGDRGKAALGGAAALSTVAITWAFFNASVPDATLYRGGLFAFGVLTCVVIYSLVEGVGPLHHVLSLRPLTALGRISYGVYLFHWPLMLVLTEDRVGLDGWALFAVQATAATALAMISARVLEGPIRYGRAQPGDWRMPVALVASIGVIAVASVALVARDVDTDLAGLGEGPGDAPIAIDDGPLDVLVIADDAGRSLMDDFETLAGVNVVEVLAFACGAESAEFACDEWAQWRRAIEAHDPDAVVVHVTDWPREDLEERVGEADLAMQRAWTGATMKSGIDVLTAQGARVLWARSPMDMAFALGQDRNPFLLGMLDATAARSIVTRLGTVGDPAGLEEILANTPRSTDGTLPRILVVGDSVSRTTGYGLEQWATSSGMATVWSAGLEGCGVLETGFIIDASGREVSTPEACADLPSVWTEQIDDFRPDLVLVMSNLFDFRERRLEDWEIALEPGDPVFDDALVDAYVDTVDVLTAQGATVVWGESMCAEDIFGVVTEPDGGSAVDIERIVHINESILPRLVDARPAVELLPFAELVCPGGEPITEVDGVGVLRPDGIHFGPDGSRWLADRLGPLLMDYTR